MSPIQPATAVQEHHLHERISSESTVASVALDQIELKTQQTPNRSSSTYQTLAQRKDTLSSFCADSYGGNLELLLQDVQEAMGRSRQGSLYQTPPGTPSLGPTSTHENRTDSNTLSSSGRDPRAPPRLVSPLFARSSRPPLPSPGFERSYEAPSTSDEGQSIHVLVCGWNTSLQYIMRLLLPERIHVTLLCNEALSDMQVNQLRQGLENGATHLHYLRGNPTQLSALHCAGIERMNGVILLAKETIPKAIGDTVEDLIHDTDVVLGFNLMNSNVTGLQSTAELIDSSSASFLEVGRAGADASRSTSPKEGIWDLKGGLAYAAGHVYTSMLSTIILAKVQTMPSIGFLIKHLVFGYKKVSKLTLPCHSL